MLYFIVTTSLFRQCNIRRSQYISGINKLREVIYNLNIKNYKIIVVENNGSRNTFLNRSNCIVFYTTNNFLKTNNKGYKELQDILDCIKKFGINDTDFIVKMTGRYILDDESKFMSIVKNINSTKHDCIIKYGSIFSRQPVNYKMGDCITGLIGMTCGYIKKIEKPNEDECVEWKWAKATYLIEDKNICIVNELGINVCPGSNRYFKI